jgi:hypothetical protein
MTLIILITFIVLVLGITFQPYIDSYIDYRGNHHIILWYNDLKGERKYLNIKGE